jgi:hypothetical protein
LNRVEILRRNRFLFQFGRTIKLLEAWFYCNVSRPLICKSLEQHLSTDVAIQNYEK